LTRSQYAVGEGMDVIVTVTIPPGAGDGDQDVATVTFASQGGSGVSVASVMTTTANVPIYRVYTAAGWLNRTHIVVSRGKLTVRHEPVPWPGNKVLEVSNFKQLYAKKTVTRSSKGGKSVSYGVNALTVGGQDLQLVGGLQNGEQAHFIEQQIEKYLGIQDVYVDGGMEADEGWW
jgi:hypothetical protein